MNEKPPGEKTERPPIDETLALEPGSGTKSDGEFTTDAVPESLGRYTIEKLLGRGGMGSVYLARDSQLERDVALKVPKFGAGTDEKLVTRFYREARSAANLAHPNLCPVFDVGEIDGTHYIAMAYIKGKPLSAFVNPDKPPAQRVVATLIRKVAVAMEEAHQSGIIHRDLKPANIMVDHRKEPIVMDFGLACPQDIGDESRLTQDGSLLGSPAYMSPEQLKGRPDAIGVGSDIYALGVVLYEMLTGRLPFDGVGSTIAMIGQILTEDPVELESVRKDIDPALATICRKAMAKDASVRFASMKEFAIALGKYLQTTSGGTTSGGATSLGEPVAKAAVNVSRIQLTEQSKLAKTLCESGQFVAAVPILKQIIANPEGEGSKMHQWATAALPKAEARIAKDAERDAAKSMPVASEDNLFASLPATPVAALSPYHRPVNAKSGSKLPSGLLIGVGAIAAVVILGVGGLLLTSSGGTSVANNDPTTSTTTRTTTAATSPSETAGEPKKGNKTLKARLGKNAKAVGNNGGLQSAATTGQSDSRAKAKFVDLLLDRFDRNNDSQLDRSEIPAQAVAPMMIGDTDSDEKLSRSELTAMDRSDFPNLDQLLNPYGPGNGDSCSGGRGRRGLMEFDTDGDGRVALSDVPGPRKDLLANEDFNGDGFLDRSEIENFERREADRREADRRPGFRPGGPGRGPGNRPDFPEGGVRPQGRPGN